MASSVSRTRLMLRHAAASFAILCLLVLLVGCGAFQEQGTGQQGGRGAPNTLRFNLQAEIPDLNSTTTTDASSFGVLNNVMEGLYRLDEDQQPQPAMAKSVEISDDKLTYTFTLRDGVKWSNGDPVTAQDFEYAWLRAMNPETASAVVVESRSGISAWRFNRSVFGSPRPAGPCPALGRRRSPPRPRGGTGWRTTPQHA